MGEKIKLDKLSIDTEVSYGVGKESNRYGVTIWGMLSQEEADQLKQQIVQNEKIVDAIFNEYNELSKHNVHGFPPKFTPYDYGMNTITNIIKKATGKDIKEIQSQDMVEN